MKKQTFRPLSSTVNFLISQLSSSTRKKKNEKEKGGGVGGREGIHC